MPIDTSTLPLSKGDSRKTIKRRKARAEAAISGDVRMQCTDRDGYCRLYVFNQSDRAVILVLFGPCSGASTWSHYETHRRFKTMRMAPEDRHQRKYSMRLCWSHHRAYDQRRIDCQPLSDAVCDGRLRWSSKHGTWEES